MMIFRGSRFRPVSLLFSQDKEDYRSMLSLFMSKAGSFVDFIPRQVKDPTIMMYAAG